MIYLNIRNWAKKLNICAVAGAMLLTFTSANAETIVHTTRYNYDADNYANSVENATALTSTAKAKQKNNGATKKKPTPRRSVPYTWEMAVEYAEMHKEDITVHKYGGYKDQYGNFSRMRVLDFLGDEGLANRGNGILGFPDFTYLRLTLNYGQATGSTQPYAIISWNFNKLAGNSSSNQILNIVFESGYVKQISTSTEWSSWIYKHSGVLVYTWANDRGGSIWLTNEDIWDIYKHGDIANVYVSSSGYKNINFFYSGNKQEEHKRQLTYGFEHLVKLLGITPATIEYDRAKRKAYEKQAYRDRLANGVKEEIYKEEIKKEISDQVKQEYQEDKRFIEEWVGK